MKTLYLYVDNFSFADIFSSNAIFCEKIMPNKKGAKSISRSSDNFLFVTHKKLNANLRMQGITDVLTNWSVVLELSYIPTKYTEFPVIFVKSDLSLEQGDLKDYNPDIYIGAYVYMEIPFTMVSHIYFENEDQLIDSDKSIFPDFLWRENIVSVINNEEFIDSIELLPSSEDLEIFTSYIDKNLSLVHILNKYKAAILQFVNGTRGWVSGKHLTTFDKKLFDFFGVDINYVKDILDSKNMTYNPLVFLDEGDSLDVIPMFKGDFSEEQKIYNLIVRVFIENYEKCNPSIVNRLLDEIKRGASMFIAEPKLNEFITTLEEIEGCYLNNVGFSLDKTLERISTVHGNNSVFKALFFVIKNPADYEKFVLSLSVYKVDSLTARRSMTLWGFLNGLRGVPASGSNRDNLVLWENLDFRASSIIDIPSYYKFNGLTINTDNTCGIVVESKEIITPEEVQAFLVEDKNRLTKGFLKDVYLVAKTCDKKISKNDPYAKYTISKTDALELLKMIDKDSDKLLTKSELDVLDKSFTKKYKDLMCKSKKSIVYDYEAIYKDWILKYDNFVKIWNLLEDKIKQFYVSQRGKNE